MGVTLDIISITLNLILLLFVIKFQNRLGKLEEYHTVDTSKQFPLTEGKTKSNVKEYVPNKKMGPPPPAPLVNIDLVNDLLDKVNRDSKKHQQESLMERVNAEVEMLWDEDYDYIDPDVEIKVESQVIKEEPTKEEDRQQLEKEVAPSPAPPKAVENPQVSLVKTREPVNLPTLNKRYKETKTY